MPLPNRAGSSGPGQHRGSPGDVGDQHQHRLVAGRQMRGDGGDLDAAAALVDHPRAAEAATGRPSAGRGGPGRARHRVRTTPRSTICGVTEPFHSLRWIR